MIYLKIVLDSPKNKENCSIKNCIKFPKALQLVRAHIFPSYLCALNKTTEWPSDHTILSGQVPLDTPRHYEAIHHCHDKPPMYNTTCCCLLHCLYTVLLYLSQVVDATTVSTNMPLSTSTMLTHPLSRTLPRTLHPFPLSLSEKDTMFIGKFNYLLLLKV